MLATTSHEPPRVPLEVRSTGAVSPCPPGEVVPLTTAPDLLVAAAAVPVARRRPPPGTLLAGGRPPGLPRHASVRPAGVAS